MGYSSSDGGLHFIQAYNRATSAFTLLKLNNSLSIRSNGNVGINSTVPGKALDVMNGTIHVHTAGKTGVALNSISGQDVGVVRWGGDNHHAIILRGSSNADGSTITGGDTMEFREYGAYSFKTGNNSGTMAERLRIASDGVVSWRSGSTPLSGTSLPYSVNIYRDGGSGYGYFDTMTNSSYSTGVRIRTYNNTTYNNVIEHTTSKVTNFQTNGLTRLSINQHGYVGVNTTSESIAGMSRYLSVSARDVNNGGAAVEIVGNRTGSDQTLGVINFVNDASNVAQITAKYQGSTTNGSLQFFTSGSERVRITDDGNLKLPDDAKIEFGGAQTGAGDLKIFHDNSATNNVIEGHTGSLNLRNYNVNSTDIVLSARRHIILQTNLNETAIQCLTNGATEIFHDGGATPKLRTTATGIEALGEVAATQDYPDIRPVLDFNFASQKKLDSRLTYTRSGPATFINEFGKVVRVGDDVPRFDHDQITRECRGLLIEETRTNNFKGCGNMGSSGSWEIGGDRGSQGANVEGPDGTLTALQNIYNGKTGDLNIHLKGGEISTSNSTAYTFSVFVKMKPGNNYINSIRMRTYNSNRSATYYIHSGSLGSINEGSSNISSRSIIEYPNGWYRCIMTFTSGTDGNQGFQIYLSNSENASLNSSSANGESMFFWGAQLEQGSFATSFIPTTSQNTATRGADIVDVDGEDFTDFYNQTESTIISSHTLLTGVPNSENVYVYQIQDATTNHGIRVIDKNGSYGNVATGLVFYGGSSQFHFNNTTDSFTKDKVLVALSVKQDDFAGCHNGGTIETDTSGTLSTSMNSLGIGRYPPSGGYELNGHIQRFIYYPKQLSDSQLKTLTS